MTSTTANNNSTSSTQPPQLSFAGPASGSTSPLASLANATEPTSLSSNQQQTPVATFPQRPTGGSPTANNGSPFGASFSQASTSGTAPSSQFTNSSSTNASVSSFPNQASANAARFSFGNLQSGTPPNFTFNQPTANAQVRQPTGTFTFTSSIQNQQMPNDISQSSSASPLANRPERPTGGSPTANNGSSFGASFSQASTFGSAPSSQFTNSSSTNASVPSFPNQAPANVARFSFGNLQSGNAPNFTFNQPTANSQVRQPVGTFTISSSTQNQQMPNDISQSSSASPPANRPQQISGTDQMARSTINNTTVFSKKLSDPPTPIAEQSGSFNQEEEEADTPASLAVDSLISKKLNTTLRDSNAIVVDRSDPNSPLYSLSKFEDLNLKPDLLKGIYNMGFQLPSKIQAIALPSLLGDPIRNIIAQSQSGTGKTGAFSLAIISRIDPSIQSPQALILAPTFELALQIGSVIERMSRFLPYIQIAYAVRDPNKSRRRDRVRNQLLPESIVIGTPGTVEEWCHKLRVIDLSQLHICCVDEADVMIATQGFREMCVNVVRGLNRNCQMMLFSATYSDEVMLFAREIVPNPVVLRLKREKQALSNIRQFFIQCYNSEQKYDAVEQIYAHITVGQAMIFCRTKTTARDLHIRMANQQHSVRELTAALDIEQRASVIQQFRDGVFRVLISTNVTSRGLDIEDVSLVINYDMPVTMNFEPDYETYLHRIGRCGRFGKLGYTFNLIGSEKDFDTMKKIETYFSHPVDEITTEAISQLEQDQE